MKCKLCNNEMVLVNQREDEETQKCVECNTVYHINYDTGLDFWR